MRKARQKSMTAISLTPGLMVAQPGPATACPLALNIVAAQTHERSQPQGARLSILIDCCMIITGSLRHRIEAVSLGFR
jgi:hypothetical protein